MKHVLREGQKGIWNGMEESMSLRHCQEVMDVTVVGGHWLEHQRSSSSELQLGCAQPCSCPQYPGVSTNSMPRLGKAPGPNADQSLLEYQKGYGYLSSG